MKEILLLNYDENTRQVIEEEKNKFFLSLLDEMGVSDPEFSDMVEKISPVQKAKLRNLLAKFNIQVIDDMENMNIYVEGKLVGKWNKPLFKIKIDPVQMDRKKQLYIELELDFWSIFEENK